MHRSLLFSIFLCYLSLQLISVLADDSPKSKISEKPGKSNSSTGLTVALTCIGLLAVFAFSVFLFKLWQRKKREEQHARLLRLFEEDDDLEVELGIRD